MNMEIKCNECSGKLSYQGDRGAPGYGQSWKCKECGASYTKVGNAVYNNQDIDPEEFIFSEWDVR